jgi:hypothetical protein
VAVVELARLFDAYLTDRPPAPAAVRARAASGARKAASPRMKVGANKALPVKMELESPGGGRAFAKIFSSGGEVSLDRGRLVFSAERAGQAQVDAFVIDEDDRVTERRTTLDVE